MRKITVISMISLDGVLQGPGGPKEDTSGGFKYGGWVAPYDDDVEGKVIKRLMQPSDILIGRKTFDIWANYWPTHSEFWPGINEVNKYVISKKLKKTSRLVTGWNNSFVLRTIADIKKLKKSRGGDLQVWGSSKLIQSLLKNDLVDELWILTYPLTLGKGKKLFDNHAMPTALTLVESMVTPKGIIIANYRKSGKVKTGMIGA
ncbi:MAG: dihydrofolate reductase family protein [Bacteroidetes bacterium]|nr:dihydrofolate reductase family protein [Bacteroidota bacterium]